jgi:hypothetical protein
MLTAVRHGSITKTTIGDTDNCGLMTFGQERLNGAADRSAAKDGQVLPHFQQIVSGASMPPCPITAVFNSSASGWSVVGWLVHNKGSRALGGLSISGKVGLNGL